MSWHTEPLCSIDAESTGVDIESDRIVTWSRWIIRPSHDGHKRHSGWLIDPGIDIPEESTKVHGITTEHARDHGQEPASAIREIAGDILYWAEQVKATVIAYNAAYDISLLHRECVRYGHHVEAEGLERLRPVVDPLVIDKGVDKYRRGSRKLIDVAKHYGIELTEDDAHSSSADSLVAARVAYVLATRYSHIGSMPADELHDVQREWKIDQAQGLQKYLRRKDPTAVVRPEWPFIPAPEVIQEQIR